MLAAIPVDADKWEADALILQATKVLMGIQGTGGFYVRSGIELKPLKYGGTGRNSAQLTYESKDYECEVGNSEPAGNHRTSPAAGWSLLSETGAARQAWT
ncbi:MAG: hypothetical protein ACLSBD_00810 [Blautia massiliensis (ex Durand et al. 2017)]